jgi:hypothetical protein
MGTRRRDAVADVRRKGTGPSRSRRSLRIVVEFDEQPMAASSAEPCSRQYWSALSSISRTGFARVFGALVTE